MKHCTLSFLSTPFSRDEATVAASLTFLLLNRPEYASLDRRSLGGGGNTAKLPAPLPPCVGEKRRI